MKSGKILVIDDNREILLAIRLLLEPYYSEVKTLDNPEKLRELISSSSFDVYILDMNFRSGINSGNEGLYWMREILSVDPDSVIILLTAYASIELAVESIKEGASDFVSKPWDDSRLIATVNSAFRLRKSKQELNITRQKQRHLNEKINERIKPFITSSPSMKELMETVVKVSASDANILLLGENGTGKEVLAREIHRLSKRSDEVFISVDLGSLSENLFESELFGYTKGAFTGATGDRPGRIELASGGTLFLDEIANIPMHLQARLLSFLQSGEINRLGSALPVRSDTRIISATNALPEVLVEQGLFRQDLLYRVNTIRLVIPPLRHRPDDIDDLSTFFIDTYCRKYNKSLKKLSPGTIKKLKSYPFPGNVRELEHMIEKAVILSDKNIIVSDDIFSGSHPSKPGMERSLDLEHNERELILTALAKSGYNNTTAAAELGISRKTLYNKIRKYGI